MQVFRLDEIDPDSEPGRSLAEIATDGAPGREIDAARSDLLVEREPVAERRWLALVAEYSNAVLLQAQDVGIADMLSFRTTSCPARSLLRHIVLAFG
jgi:hypothetical protein